MAIDLQKMREKYEKLKGGGSNSDTELFWKPQDGTQMIRIVSPQNGDPFRDLFFHYGLGENQRTSALCPKRNYGEKCPVCDFANGLWEEGDSDSQSMAKDYFAKMRVFAPVVVRGEEDKGVRLWGFSKTAYESLLNIVLDPEYGDITDVENGTDLRIDYGKKAGQSFPTTDIRPARRTSPLAETDEQITKILETVPDFESAFERKTTDEVKTLLEQALGNETTAETGSSETTRQGGNKETSNVSDIDDAFNELLA